MRRVGWRDTAALACHDGRCRCHRSASPNFGLVSQGPPSTAAERFKISQLVALVAQGKIRIPKFQRPPRWDRNNRLELFDSIYRGYPIGTLLFWRRDAPKEIIRLGSLRIEAPEFPDALWVVDGQQRLRTLASALLPAKFHEGKPEEEILFDVVAENFMTAGRSVPSSKRFPLRGAHETRGTLQWLREHEVGDVEYDRIAHLSDRLQNFEVPAYVVETDEEADLRLIFDRTNTSGKRLKRAEVFHALSTSNLLDSSDQPNLRRLDPVTEEYEFGSIAPDTLLKCVLAMRSPDITRDFRGELELPSSERSADIDRASSALGHAVRFLQEDARIPHFRLLPYQFLLVCLVRYFGFHPEPAPYTRVALRRWFWRTAAAGPPGRRGHTGFMRQLLAAVEGDDAEASVERLLALVPINGPTDLGIGGRFGLNRSQSRIAAAALAALGPIDLEDHQPIDVRSTLEEHGTNALLRIHQSVVSRDEGTRDDLLGSPDVHADLETAADRRVLLGQTVANRIFVSSQALTLGIGNEELGDALTRMASVANGVSADEVLASHAIPRHALLHLAEERTAQFLLERHEAMAAAVAAFVNGQAEWQFDYRQSIDALLRTPLDR